jgi:hypothetical protein
MENHTLEEEWDIIIQPKAVMFDLNLKEIVP